MATKQLGTLSDAQLLEWFVNAWDEAALEVLVWRHDLQTIRTSSLRPSPSCGLF